MIQLSSPMVCIHPLFTLQRPHTLHALTLSTPSPSPHPHTFHALTLSTPSRSPRPHALHALTLSTPSHSPRPHPLHTLTLSTPSPSPRPHPLHTLTLSTPSHYTLSDMLACMLHAISTPTHSTPHTDIAVSAPFGAGNGTVFIYYSSPTNTISPTPAQVLYIHTTCMQTHFTLLI